MHPRFALLRCCELLLLTVWVGWAQGAGSCQSGDLPCDDGQCVPSYSWCDNNADCQDNSDESYCKKKGWVNWDPNKCEETHYLCDDGRCVPLVAKCDGHPDCKDESDEKNCDESSKSPSEEDTSFEDEDQTKSAFSNEDSDTATNTPFDIFNAEIARFTNAETTAGSFNSISTPITYYDKKMNGIAENSRDPYHTPRTYKPTYATRQTLRTDAPTARYPQSPPTQPLRPRNTTPYPHPLPFSQSTHPPQSRFTTVSPQRPPIPQYTTHPSQSRYPNNYPYQHPYPYPQHPYPHQTPSRQQSEIQRTYYGDYGLSNQRDGRQDVANIHPPYVYPHSNDRSHRYDNGRNDYSSTAYSGHRKAPSFFYFAKNYTKSYENINDPSVRRGQQWLLTLRDPSGGWGNDTYRVLVALSLLNNSFIGGSNENELMKKYLQVHLGMKLLSPQSLQPNQFATFINALLATCQDPKDFLDVDLVQLLRKSLEKPGLSRVREAPFVSPFVQLSLCLANETLASNEVHLLMRTLSGHLPTSERGKDMLSLSISAFACYLQSLDSTTRNTTYAQSLFEVLGNGTSMLLQLMLEDGSFGSVYSTSLAAQALLSVNDSRGWNPEMTFRFLREQQTRNGSFGDLLATYYTLPVLRGRSLLHLRNTQCDPPTQDRDLTPQEILDYVGPKQYIRYSLYFGNPLRNAYSVEVAVPHGINFFDVMRIAQFQNHHFKFLYEKKNETIKVYSISDVPNNSEQGLAWHLYIKRNSDANPNVLNIQELYTRDITELLPRAYQHIVFWYHSVHFGYRS